MPQHPTGRHTAPTNHHAPAGEREGAARTGGLDSMASCEGSAEDAAAVGDLEAHLVRLHDEALRIVEEESALQATSSAAAHWQLARTAHRFLTTPAARLPDRAHQEGRG